MTNPLRDPGRFEPPLELVWTLDFGQDGCVGLWRATGTQDYYTGESRNWAQFQECQAIGDLDRLSLRSFPHRNLVTFRSLAERVESEHWGHSDPDAREDFIKAVADAERQYGARNDLRTRRPRCERHLRP